MGYSQEACGVVLNRHPSRPAPIKSDPKLLPMCNVDFLWCCKNGGGRWFYGSQLRKERATERGTKVRASALSSVAESSVDPGGVRLQHLEGITDLSGAYGHKT
eukprot:4846513-Amphidinium_carterae.1